MLVRQEIGDVTVVLRHNLPFCREFPTAAHVAGNDGVRSLRDNEDSAGRLAAQG